MKKNVTKKPLQKISLAIHVLWLLIIVASYSINHFAASRFIKDSAIAEAKAIFERDKAYRLWAASHGGVYVPVTEDTPPNPYLKHIPDREIRKPSGQLLTLMNPAYMIRQINENVAGRTGIVGHITSLKPLRPQNAPVYWEAQALKAFENGKKEVIEFTETNGERFLRYMQAMKVEAACLKCHSHQGYQVGDVRGGISVLLPMESRYATHAHLVQSLLLWHILIYLTGFMLILFGNRYVLRRTEERDKAALSRLESEEKFRTLAEFTYAWEYWIDPDGIFKYNSPSVERLTGYEAEKLFTGREFFKKLVVEEDHGIFFEHLNSNREEPTGELDFRIITSSGEKRWLRHLCRPIYGAAGEYLGRRASNYDITKEKQVELNNKKLIADLEDALAQVKLLKGFLPICANCKKIRDDKGFWNQIEVFMSEHSEAVLSLSICPDCTEKLYPESSDTDDHS